MKPFRSVLVIIVGCLAARCSGASFGRQSKGCEEPRSWAHKGDGQSNFVHVDEQPWREFLIDIPSGAQDAAPLLFSFHGQTGTALHQRKTFDFAQVADDTIVVYPQGLDDSDVNDAANPSKGTGWNVGTAGDNSTCTSDAADYGYTSCYASCKAMQKCGSCDWSTCYDDVLFVKALLTLVTESLCVDLDRIYVHGCSNGGMLTHYLLQKMPDVFAAAVPQYALPLLGHMGYPPSLEKTAVMSLYDRNDSVIPWGPFDVNQGWGWLYPSLHTVMSQLAKIHGCSQPGPTMTPWDGGFSNVSCTEYHFCRSGRRILQCMYDGSHGQNPQGNSTQGEYLATDFILWFLRSFSRSAEGSEGSSPQRRLQDGFLSHRDIYF